MASNTSITSSPAFAADLGKLRDMDLRPACVRATVAKLTAILAKDAIALPVADDEIIAIIVILRSGMAMMESFISAFPKNANIVIYHLGLFRESQTLQPVEYYNKLPRKHDAIKRAYVLDPLIATGGTAAATIRILKTWGVGQIVFVSLLASQAGLQNAATCWSEGTKFVIGAQDAELDDKGYVKPGLGDIGYRLYGTILY